MIPEIKSQLKRSAELKSRLAAEMGGAIEEAAMAIIDCYRRGGKLLIAGNGGSAADAQHLAAEFVGRFEMERRALPALALTTDTSILTALSNDYGFDGIFARQIEAHGRPGDVFIAISTSGESRNLLEAAAKARKLGIKVIAFSGRDGGKLSPAADIALTIPEQRTARIQECHITIGHIICSLVESRLPASSR